ncbi:MAG: class I SAM-dependent methyltransferase [Opitutaceae bacterium]|nr:class I SAM-dependent methyltransferase [Opitutaceae bacterium]
MIRPLQGIRLFDLAKQIQGNILEIGSWVGKSTTYIANGVRLNPNKPPFYTVDNYFTNTEEWESFYGESLNDNPEWARNIYLKHIERKGGVIESLRENLADRDLLHLVKILKGDFLSFEFPKKFELIFCDASHDASEVKRNLPKIISLLEPEGILVCDDFRYPDMFDALDEIHRFKHIYTHRYMIFATNRKLTHRLENQSFLGCKRYR